MIKILVSACLLNQPVRYDGRTKPLQHKLIEHWKQEGRLLAICPELAGGLPVPRPAVELHFQPTTIKAVDVNGNDYTEAFLAGSHLTLQQAQRENARLAILTEASPSCGSHWIYDGSFTGKQIAGQGIATQLFEAHGIRVFAHTDVEAAAAYLNELQASA